MSAEPERDQLDIWNKLNSLYGDEDNREQVVGSNEQNEEKQSSADDETAEESFFVNKMKPDNFQQERKSDDPVQKSVKVRSQSNSMGVERLNETCARCKRTCKQNTKKLNRMLCIGFIPIDSSESKP